MNDKSPESKILNLLEWASSRSDIFERPTIRHLNHGSLSIFRSTVEINNEFLGLKDPIFGTGRDVLPSVSMGKAYAEALERVAMIHFRRERNEKPFILSDDLESLVQPEETDEVSVPLELVTSNGWAVHFDATQSLKNSLKESIERHLLQASFYRGGWQSFELVKSEKFGDFQQEFFRSKYNFLNYEAGIVRSKSNRHSGFTYGYFAENKDLTSGVEAAWSHAVLESVEPLYFYDQMDREQIERARSKSQDFLERAQIDLLLKTEDELWNKSELSPSDSDWEKTAFIEEAKIFVVQSNLKEKLGFSFDFYATFIYSPAMFTLFPSNIRSVDAQAWVNRTFAINKISIEGIYPNAPIY